MMATTKSVRITCDTKLRIPYSELHGIQGVLKSMTKENFSKLRRWILEDGFNFAIHVWKEETTKVKKKPVVKWWIIDGHGRREIVRYLVEEEGYLCDALPCVEIEASSYKQAKRKVLNASSSFNTMTNDGLYSFMTDAELGLDEMEDFVLAEIDMPEFKMAHFGDPAQDAEAQEGPEKVSFDAYKNAAVKQVVLYYAQGEYETIIKGLDALMERWGLDDYSQVVWRLAREANSA